MSTITDPNQPKAGPAIEDTPECAALDPRVREAIRPNFPADDAPFEDFANSYNFRNSSDRRLILTRQIIRECLKRRAASGSGEPLRVIDIGCGRGMGRSEDYVAAVKPYCDELWGIEPDTEVTPNPALFDHTQHALLEDADLPENHFDVAFSFMVMEHVADPGAFYRALARAMKPGGVYLFMTPNKDHYFSIFTRTFKALKLDEFVLKFISGGDVGDYHYPVVHRCNSRAQLVQHGKPAGFTGVEVAYMEQDGPRPYMKGPLRPLFHLLAWKRTKVRRPDRLLTLFARMTKAG